MDKEKLDEFISKHKAKYTNYCEAIITEDGVIHYATPSHQNKLIELYGVPMIQGQVLDYDGKEFNDLKNKIPVYANFTYWLADYLDMVVTWYDYIVFPLNYTKDQTSVVKSLIENDVLSRNSRIILTKEYHHCTLFEYDDEPDETDFGKLLKEFDKRYEELTNEIYYDAVDIMKD